ncbi:hypothetical protein VP01_1532g10 [Puccinia sorghi]|uniref:Uncharacterized protein n=1 Tax=Puccinia sorghi TaxID=27349 RepID=A0A0L6VIH5_9BASI|nr:hypothetical protein VP01_1532g10 [Puccinia sorghi]
MTCFTSPCSLNSIPSITQKAEYLIYQVERVAYILYLYNQKYSCLFLKWTMPKALGEISISMNRQNSSKVCGNLIAISEQCKQDSLDLGPGLWKEVSNVQNPGLFPITWLKSFWRRVAVLRCRQIVPCNFSTPIELIINKDSFSKHWNLIQVAGAKVLIRTLEFQPLNNMNLFNKKIAREHIFMITDKYSHREFPRFCHKRCIIFIGREELLDDRDFDLICMRLSSRSNSWKSLSKRLFCLNIFFFEAGSSISVECSSSIKKRGSKGELDEPIEVKFLFVDYQELRLEKSGSWLS